MKRFLCLALVLALLPLGGLAASKKSAKAKNVDNLPETLTMTAGKFLSFKLTYTGEWENSAPEVVHVEKDVTSNEKRVRITAYAPGEAVLKFKTTKAKTPKTAEIRVTVEPEAAYDGVPEKIRKAIDTGIAEWQAAGGKAFSQAPKNNPYTKWWGYACGWCGAFCGYCLASADVPMEPSDTYKKVKPTKDGAPHSIREAAVQKLDTGFGNMQRTTRIPRPGYLVIYGQKGGYAFKHVGLVTDVLDRGDGSYVICTVEGNLGNRIKRISYVYTLTAADNQNMSVLPKAEQTDAKTFQYTLQQKNWYITEFCQTWY